MKNTPTRAKSYLAPRSLQPNVSLAQGFRDRTRRVADISARRAYLRAGTPDASIRYMTRAAFRLAAVTLVALAAGVSAQSFAAPAPTESPVPLGAPCVWELKYTLNANLKLTDTPLGQGDGIVKIGPGRVVLRFEDQGGQPGGAVKMLGYQMKDHFTVKTHTLFWNTVVENDTLTRSTPDACGVSAKGTLKGNQLSWQSPVRGYRVDGTIKCTGALCGKFGAPPEGTSQIHIAPSPVPFKTFTFGKGLSTFQMPYTFVTKTAVPKQTSYLALGGTLMSKRCVPVKACK